ncbi:hypothetical protein D3C73_1144260 [compost metagenome]
MDGCQLSERLHCLVGRAAPALTDIVQRGHMVHQGMTVSGQCLVKVAKLRFKRLLIAHDGPDQLTLELLGSGAVTRLEEHRLEAKRFEVGGKTRETGLPVPHHQHGLAFTDQRADGIDGGLRLPAPGRSADNQ